MITDTDRKHLQRCVALAEQALDTGSRPFGSLLVAASGEVLFEDHNRSGEGDVTLHPEFAIARWAIANLAPAERATAVVYTSGEHCPMCAAAHAYAGLGRIVYASSSEQLGQWLAALGVPRGPVNPLPIQVVAPGVPVDGPVAQFAEAVHALQVRCHRGA